MDAKQRRLQQNRDAQKMFRSKKEKELMELTMKALRYDDVCRQLKVSLVTKKHFYRAGLGFRSKTKLPIAC